jgi:hypothetical protein
VNLVGAYAARWVDGFVWRPSGRKLTREHDGYREEIRFQGSRYIRAGYLVEVWLFARAANKAVKAWRRANSSLVVRNDDTVFGGLAGNVVGRYRAGQFQFAPDGGNEGEMKRMSAFLVEIVVPCLELAHDPDHFAAHAPAVSLEDPAAAEWLLSLGAS